MIVLFLVVRNDAVHQLRGNGYRVMATTSASWWNCCTKSAIITTKCSCSAGCTCSATFSTKIITTRSRQVDDWWWWSLSVFFQKIFKICNNFPKCVWCRWRRSPSTTRSLTLFLTVMPLWRRRRSRKSYPSVAWCPKFISRFATTSKRVCSSRRIWIWALKKWMILWGGTPTCCWPERSADACPLWSASRRCRCCSSYKYPSIRYTLSSAMELWRISSPNLPGQKFLAFLWKSFIFFSKFFNFFQWISISLTIFQLAPKSAVLANFRTRPACKVAPCSATFDPTPSSRSTKPCSAKWTSLWT